MSRTIYKQAMEIMLRSGEKLIVTVAEGEDAKRAKASNQSKSVIFPSLRNRMVDVTFMVDIQPKSVEDAEATRKLADEEAKRNLIATGLLEAKTDTKYLPGYIKYIVASIKLRKKIHRGTSDIRERLDEEQIRLVTAELEKQSLGW